MQDSELKAHFKVINDRLTKIEKAQGIFSTDLAKDRGDLHDFTVEVARLGAIVDSVRKGQNNQTEKIADAVGDAIDEAVKPIVEAKWKFWKKAG